MRLRVFNAATELKLAALWTATMFCYVYCDYFGLYAPGALASIGRGDMGPAGHATPVMLAVLSAMMAVPSLMIALSLFLPPPVCRWSNVILGLVYSAIVGASVPGSEPFYKVMAVIEIVLTLSIAVVALRWPAGHDDD